MLLLFVQLLYLRCLASEEALPDLERPGLPTVTVPCSCASPVIWVGVRWNGDHDRNRSVIHPRLDNDNPGLSAYQGGADPTITSRLVASNSAKVFLFLRSCARDFTFVWSRFSGSRGLCGVLWEHPLSWY